MQIQPLRESIQEISEIASSVPEEFREKCFELLMNNLLQGGNSSTTLSSSPPMLTGMPIQLPASMGYSGAPPMTPLLAAFIKKIRLTNEQFAQIVGYLHGQVSFFREPAATKSAKAQIEWTLLLALKNVILKGGFLVDAEEVRLTCEEKGIFDRRNFYANFRRQAEYFRAPPEPGGKAQPLSAKGITALGNLVRHLAGLA
jgi:hypothetical protein